MPRTRSAVMPLSRQVQFTSKINRRPYKLRVSLPFMPAPEAGYPVVYVLDGDGYFGTFAEAVRLCSTPGGELEPAVVVGIGYPGEDMLAVMRRRFFDLTPEVDESVKAASAMGMGEVDYGGADGFLEAIEREIKPRVAALAPVDPARASLFGHSLGGLFVLHALFTRPRMFATYLSLSPSIWWADKALLGRIEGFAARLAAEKLSPRLFIGVGGEEQAPPRKAMGGMTLEALTERVSMARMVDNAVELGERLATLPGGDGWRVRRRVYDGCSHGNVPWAAVGAMLGFAIPQPD